MSDAIDDDDDIRPSDGHVNGGTVSDEDVRAMLATEQRATRALKLQLETERSGRSRAEAQVTNATSARFESEEQAVTTRLEAADAQGLVLRRQLADAMAEGRFDEVAEVQDNLAELRARQHSDKQYKVWLAGEKLRVAKAPEPASDTVDLSSYSKAQRAWIKKNPDFMDDPAVRQKTFAGHQIALAEGIAVDSPEYFEIIDETVARGAAQRRPAQDDPEPIDPPRRRQDPTDMPVTRRAQVAQPTAAKQVRLTADQMEAADITCPDIPVQGHKDPSGNWVPGRYERYVLQMAALKRRTGG
jgi:hypothetical protein